MNISRSKRVSKKRFIPGHFRRRNLPSIYEILNAAAYRRRNKELLWNNKALAGALQEAQCVISSNNRMLRNLTKDSNQVLLARLKMRSMAITIQKLVVDLDDVMQCLDISCMNIPQLNINEDVRLKIPEPDLEKIDESVLSRENEEILSENKGPLIECESPEITSFFGNSSVTEIYNVQQYLPNAVDKVKDVQAETSAVDTIETTPQLNLIHSSRISESKQSQNQNKKVDVPRNSLCSPVNIAKSAETSKIPVRKNLFLESEVMDPPLVLNNENRRETFVVKNFAENDRLNQVSASLKRGTFTIAEMCREMQAQKDSRGTFVVPAVPSLNISKPSHKIPPPSEDFCIDDKTVHLSEDMDLTEIIPSATLAAASKSLLNKNGQLQLGNVVHPSICKNIEIGKTDLSPPIINMNKISPIAKLSMKSDSNKQELETSIETKLVDSTPPETVISSLNKMDLEHSSEDVFFSEQDVSIQGPSRKSVLPSFVSLSTCGKLSMQKKSIRDVLSSDVGSNNQIRSDYIEKPISESHEITGSSTISKKNIDASTLLSKTVTSPKKNAENNILFEEISSDSDPDFIVDAPVACERKRISGRKSIKPNHKKPIIFKNSKSRKSIGKTKDNSDLLSEIKEKYDFSSSDSEEESSKNMKTAKCKSQKKSCSKLGKSKEKSTVAILERDINLKLQDQSRKKRSLKRRVSFVGLNASPSKKDEEDENFNEPTEQSTTLQTGDKEIEIRGPRKSILKRKSVVVSEKQGSSSNLNFKNVLEHEDLQEKKSASTVIAVSDKSDDEEVSSKESKIQEKEINEKLKPIFENSTDDKQNEASQSEENFIPKTSKEEIKPNKFSLKSNKHKSMDAENDKNILDVEKNNKPQPHVKKLTVSSSENSGRSRKSSKSQPEFKAIPDTKEETERSELKRSSKISRNFSDIFRLSNETSTRNKSKRTFSGVSERSSKKRFTSNDDILEDVISKFNEIVPKKIPEGNMKNFNKSDLVSENIISGTTNIINSLNKKDSCSNLKEDSQLRTNELEKHIAIAKSSEQNIKENAESPSHLSEKEIEICTNLKLNSKMKSNVKIKSHNGKTSTSSEPMCNSELNNGKNSAETVTSQYSKTDTKVCFEKDLSAGSNLKENFEEKKKSNDKAKVESDNTVLNPVDVDGQSDRATNSLTVELKNDTEVKTDLLLNSKKKRKNNSKPKQSAEICVLSELPPNNKLTEENKSSKKSTRGTSPPSSKLGKTVSGGNELKENLVIPDLESGGRSRRTRPTISFKEPSLNTKMRRAK